MKMTNSKSLVVGLGVLFLLLPTPLPSLAKQDRPGPPLRSNNPSSYRYAHEHGYRAGYEDGYETGKHDFENNQQRDFARSQDYQRADRTYESRMGELREYQDGYQAGFELA